MQKLKNWHGGFLATGLGILFDKKEDSRRVETTGCTKKSTNQS
jgi:hypothetical protein